MLSLLLGRWGCLFPGWLLGRRGGLLLLQRWRRLLTGRNVRRSLLLHLLMSLLLLLLRLLMSRLLLLRLLSRRSVRLSMLLLRLLMSLLLL